jgi:hypothetical protein
MDPVGEHSVLVGAAARERQHHDRCVVTRGRLAEVRVDGDAERDDQQTDDREIELASRHMGDRFVVRTSCVRLRPSMSARMPTRTRARAQTRRPPAGR